MYTSFRVKNFRCFEDLELKDLARVNLIAGKNNVGKTALLEAILLHTGQYDIVLSRMERGLDNGRRQLRQSRTYTVSGLHEWDSLFNEFDTSRKITVSGDYSVPEPQLPLPGYDNGAPLIISTVNIKNVAESESHIVRELRRLQHVSVDLEPVAQDIDVLQFVSVNKRRHYMAQYRGQIVSDNILPPSSVQATFLPAREKVAVEDDAERFSALKRQREMDLLVNTLQIIEPRLIGLDLLANGIHGDIEGMNQLVPLSVMGDGVTRLTSLVLAVATFRNGIIVVDEIENGLHYSILADIWKAIATAAHTFNTQIFATTHSREMILAAHQAFSERETYNFRLHRLDRSKKTGQIKAVTYDKETLEAAIDSDFEVR